LEDRDLVESRIIEIEKLIENVEIINDKDKSTRMARSLTIRIILSVFLFILLLIGYSMGWITPNFV